MIKVMVLLSRLPGVTREEFKAYYETKHAPLIASLVPTLAAYRRNYPDVRDARFPPGMNDVDFDSATELGFADHAGFDAFKRITSDPEVLKIIRADEANFLDHTKTHWFVMEEHSSNLAKPYAFDDVEALKQLKHLYGKLVDRCPDGRDEAAQALSELFTEDCVADFTQIFGKVFNGRAELRAHFGKVLPDARAWMWHSFTNPIIEIDGHRAKVEWLLYAMSTPRDDPQAEPSPSYGRYFDEYVRTPDGWKQSRLFFQNETRARPAG